MRGTFLGVPGQILPGREVEVKPRRPYLGSPLMILAVLGTLMVTGCGDKSTEPECTVDTTYNPTIDPGSFQAPVDNPLFPLVAGTRLTYTAGSESIFVEVLAEKKSILGVSCTVVHDFSRSGGQVIEDTYDWFAQDTSGAVWYFGEDTRELSGGHVVSTEGSWEAGVDGAKPGIIIPAAPVVGQTYRQEYYACVAEDMGEVQDLNASVTVPYGSFVSCIRTRDFTPLDPEVNESKYYAPGIGLVLTVDMSTNEREELVAVTHR
jgi:hypothetical protein